MIINQKEIVLLPFPFSNLGGKKIRPALIVSNNSLNIKSDDCIMVPLTTIIKNEPFSVIINQNDFSSGKLLKPSRIRVDKIFSVNKNLISMKIGKLTNDTFKAVRKELDKLF